MLGSYEQGGKDVPAVVILIRGFEAMGRQIQVDSLDGKTCTVKMLVCGHPG